MPKFIDPFGQSCSHTDAHFNGRLRSGYRAVMGDGERVSFDLSMMDSRGPAGTFIRDANAVEPPKTIDEAVKRAIEAEAKRYNLKPSQWLTQNAGAKLTDLVKKAAEDFVNSAGAAGVATHFSVDRLAMAAISNVAFADLATGKPDAQPMRSADYARGIYDAAIKKRQDEMHNGWRRQSAPSN